MAPLRSNNDVTAVRNYIFPEEDDNEWIDKDGYPVRKPLGVRARKKARSHSRDSKKKQHIPKAAPAPLYHPETDTMYTPMSSYRLKKTKKPEVTKPLYEDNETSASSSSSTYSSSSSSSCNSCLGESSTSIPSSARTLPRKHSLYSTSTVSSMQTHIDRGTGTEIEYLVVLFLADTFSQRRRVRMQAILATLAGKGRTYTVSHVDPGTCAKRLKAKQDKKPWASMYDSSNTCDYRGQKFVTSDQAAVWVAHQTTDAMNDIPADWKLNTAIAILCEPISVSASVVCMLEERHNCPVYRIHSGKQLLNLRKK